MGNSQAAETHTWGPHVPEGFAGCGEKRNVLITGGNSGLGFETARVLLVKGYKVVIACRNEQRAAEAVEKLKSLTGSGDCSYAILDVSSLASVDAFADDFLADESNLCHVLICNAGISKSPHNHTLNHHFLDPCRDHCSDGPRETQRRWLRAPICLELPRALASCESTQSEADRIGTGESHSRVFDRCEIRLHSLVGLSFARVSLKELLPATMC